MARAPAGANSTCCGSTSGRRAFTLSVASGPVAAPPRDNLGRDASASGRTTRPTLRHVEQDHSPHASTLEQDQSPPVVSMVLHYVRMTRTTCSAVSSVSSVAHFARQPPTVSPPSTTAPRCWDRPRLRARSSRSRVRTSAPGRRPTSASSVAVALTAARAMCPGTRAYARQVVRPALTGRGDSDAGLACLLSEPKSLQVAGHRRGGWHQWLGPGQALAVPRRLKG